VPKKNRTESGTSQPAKASLAKMSEDERREIQRLVKSALRERNLPRFKSAMLKLGFDESSAEYEKMLQLWDEYARSSRHG
jgi:hypothetical protein